jgi:homoserine O-succinyltransferase
LQIIAFSEEAGVTIVKAKNGRQLFITGHSEYSRHTLDSEYKRDKSKNLPIDIPVNYYLNDNPKNIPVMRWKSTANLFFSNWLNYYVYQETPYDLEEIQ